MSSNERIAPNATSRLDVSVLKEIAKKELVDSLNSASIFSI